MCCTVAILRSAKLHSSVQWDSTHPPPHRIFKRLLRYVTYVAQCMRHLRAALRLKLPATRTQTQAGLLYVFKSMAPDLDALISQLAA